MMAFSVANVSGEYYTALRITEPKEEELIPFALEAVVYSMNDTIEEMRAARTAVMNASTAASKTRADAEFAAMVAFAVEAVEAVEEAAAEDEEEAAAQGIGREVKLAKAALSVALGQLKVTAAQLNVTAAMTDLMTTEAAQLKVAQLKVAAVMTDLMSTEAVQLKVVAEAAAVTTDLMSTEASQLKVVAEAAAAEDE